MPIQLSPRATNLAIFIFTLIAMAFALWLQHHDGLEPCPLCIFQRIAMIAVSVVTLLAVLHNPHALGRRIYGGLTLLASLGGVAVAGRHVWLQHLPPEQVPACGPGLSYWLEVFPLQDVIQKVFRGSGECAKIDWAFLGFSLPELTLVVFLGLMSVAVWQITRKN